MYNDRNKSTINNGAAIDLILCYLITSGEPHLMSPVYIK